MKHIGNEIDALLFQKQIKKKDFANSIGMSDVNLSKVLKKVSLDAALLEKIATALNIPASYFFNDNNLSSFETTLIKAGKPTLITELERVGRSAPSTDPSTANEARLWAMIESQQRMLESQQRTIEEFTKKRIAEAAPGVAPMAARG